MQKMQDAATGKQEIRTITTEQDIHIAFICDDNYALCTGVAIGSLKQHRDCAYTYHIHIICDQVSQTNLKLFAMYGDDHFLIDILDAADITTRYKDFDRMRFAQYVSQAALFKFDLADIFPKVNKLLYMDGDILIRDSLVDLYQINIKDKVAAVCKDIGAEVYPAPFNQRLGIHHENYFNSGIMLLNLQLMREENIKDKLIDYKCNGKNDFMDQDALNVVFSERVDYFSFLYNMTLTGWYTYPCEVLNTYFGLDMPDKASFYQQAKILHLCGPEKPWKYYNVVAGEEWWAVYVHSPFVLHGIQREKYHGTVSYRDEISEEMDMLTLPPCETQGWQFDQEPLVSVVSPVYNAEKYLPECIESLMGQTLQNCEFIFVDDGSTDRSLEILQMYARLDSRIRILTQKNSYAGIARNNGIAHARGKYVTFLDSDDIMHPNALEVFYRRAKTLDVDVVISAAAIFSDDIAQSHRNSSSLRMEFLPNKRVFSKDTWPKYLMQITAGMPWGKFIKRELLLENHIQFPALPRSEDISFTFWALAAARSIATINQNLIYYRIMPGNGSLEDCSEKYPLASVEGYKILRENLISMGVYDMLKQTFDNYVLNSLAFNLNKIKNGNAFKTLADCVCFEVLPLFEIDLTQENYFYFPKDLTLFQELAKHSSTVEYLYQAILDGKLHSEKTWKERQKFKAERDELAKKLQNVKQGQMPVADPRLESELRTLRQEKSERWQEIQNLRKQNGERYQQIQALTKEKGERYQELQELRKQNGERYQQIQTLQKEKGERYQELQELRKQNAECRQELQSLRKQNGERYQTIQALQKEKGERWQELQRLRKENAELLQEVRIQRKVKKVLRLK